ncbi:hypothetical protein BDR07DRAFT_1494121 [Suillus spraguei]|nr:hypothetical protein BDR07DRAFT_1494121 [Suillus spraguei]
MLNEDLAVNALAHFVQPTKFPLLSSSDTDLARLHYGNAIIEHHVMSSQLPSLPPTSVSITPLSSTIPSPPVFTSVSVLPVLPTILPHESIAPIFMLKKKQSHVDMLDDDSDTAEPQFRGQLVDIEPKKQKNTNGKTALSPEYHRKTSFNQALIYTRGMNNVSIHKDEYSSQELSTCPDTGGHDSDLTMAYKMVERWHPDISFSNLDSIISTPKEPAAHQSHKPTGSYLSVGTDEQEEILEDEKDTWLDEKLAAEPAQD